MHSANRQRKGQGVVVNLVAEALDQLDDALGRLTLGAGAKRAIGKVDRYLLDLRQLAYLALNFGRAGAAAHALDRKFQVYSILREGLFHRDTIAEVGLESSGLRAGEQGR